MTREEAIRWLEDIHRRFNPTGENLENEGGDVHLQALDMAIESLSADRPTVDKEYLIDLIQEAVYDGEACAKLIDLVDRPTGEWVEEDEYGDLLVCSECGFANDYKDNYCPNCGARMEGGEEE